MPDVTADIIERLSELIGVVAQQQVFIGALIDYVREQPNYDASRLSALVTRHRQKLALKPNQATSLDDERTNAALLALLKAIEGPIQ